MNAVLHAATNPWLAAAGCCCSCTHNNSSSSSSIQRSKIRMHSSAALSHINAVPHRGKKQAAAAAALTAAVTSSSSSGGFTAADADDGKTTAARLFSLYDFVSEHQRLPDVQDSYQGVAVGQWAERCRQLQQQQGLEPDLAAALQSIPGWSWQPQVTALSVGFQRNLQQLAAYAHRHGPPPQRSAKRFIITTTSSSSSSSEGGGGGSGSSVQLSAVQSEEQVAFHISKQLVDQRKRGVLTQQQIDAISDQVPGWRWDQRIRSPPLEQTIRHLQAFHSKHGRLPKPDERLANGFLLGEWCMMRRGEYSRGQLEVDVAAALEGQVPGWLWNRLDTVFEKNLEALAGFVAAHGRTPTQREAWGSVRVGAWCNKRRLQYKAGSLAADRVAALEAIPGWWWSCDQMPDVP